MAFATWDSGNANNVTLDGTALAATALGTNGGYVRGTAPQATGKFYWEVTVNTWAGAGTRVGLAKSTASLGSLYATPTGAAVLERSGTVRVNNTVTGGSSLFGTRASGDTIGVAVDLAANLIWFRVAPSGLWNASSSADPATGAGGFSISSITTPADALYPVAGFNATGDKQTANFGQSAFVGAVPSGFTAGWTTGEAVTHAVATQVGAEQWFTGQGTASVTQVGYEAWFSIVPAAVVTQLGYEAWVSVAQLAAAKAKRRLMVISSG